MAKRFEAPIPGQSLTEEPSNRPYERPPEITDIEQAIQMHTGRLAERITDIVDALEMGIDVETLTKGLLRSAVAEGVHTIDVGLIIAPAIHEFIKTTAQSMQVDFDEGFENEQEIKDRRKTIESSKRLHSVLSEEQQFEEEDDLLAYQKEAPVDEPLTERPEPSGGFMSRPVRNEEVV